MTTFAAYYDETGLEGADGVLRLVGLFGRQQEWFEFDKAWKSVLNAHPPTRYWHTVSAHNGKLFVTGGGQLERRDRERKEEQLIDVLAAGKEAFATIEIEMDMQTHRRVVQGRIRARKFAKKLGPYAPILSNPMFVLTRVAITATDRMAAQWNEKLAPGDPIQVWNVFEDNEAIEGVQVDVQLSALMLKKTVDRNLRSRIGPVLFLPSKGALGQTTLQAVDFYAWHLNRPSVAGEHDPGWEKLKGFPRNRVVVSEEYLRGFVNDVNQGVRLSLD